jgi:uncharacterized protein
MKLFVISDIHGETKYFDAAAGLIDSADLVVISGDLTKNGTRDSAEEILERIERRSKKIIAVHGNWDKDEVRQLLDQKGYGIHGKGQIIKGIGFFGVGGSSQTPMNTTSEYTDEELYKFLSAGYHEVAGSTRTVLVSHAPPRRVRDRTFIGLRGGSQAVREFINAHHVDLCLTGHIHEAFGIDELGGCRVVNSGSFKKGRYSLIDVGDSITATQGTL